MSARVGFFLVLGFAFLWRPGAAQTSSPRDVATRFLTAWDARQWADAARLIDLDGFDTFRRGFAERAAEAGEQTVTIDEILRHNPGMPREAAEYQLQMIREQQRKFADPTPFEFARVASLADLQRLPAAEAAARWLESRDPSWQIRMQFEQAGCRPPDDADDVPRPRRRLLGLVDDGASLSFGVFRETRGDAATTTFAGGDVFILTLLRTGDGWRVAPRADLLPEIGMVDTSGCRPSDRR